MDYQADRAARLVALIEDHLATGKYDWARDTLEGIHDTVQRLGVATLRQQEAVEHIIVGRLKHDAR